MKPSKGVIFYSIGTKMLVRLAVAMYSLRKIYKDKCTLIAAENGLEESKRIAELFDINIRAMTEEKDGRNCALLTKTKLAEYTPYDISVFLDADTLILRDFKHLFKWAEHWDYVACEFCDWTMKTKRIQGRVREVDPFIDFFYKGAISYNYPYAINGGVMAFKKTSEFMKEWFDHTIKCRHVFIPDEKATQAVLWRYKHYVADQRYNCSCKYGEIQDAKIIHFHGDKHCRIKNGQYQHNAELWYYHLDEIMRTEKNIWKEIKPYIRHDRQLRKNYDKHKELQIA